MKKTSILIGLMVSFLFFLPTNAETPLDSLEMKLSIETQDLLYDFEDEDESIEKEREVIYRLEVSNHGTKTLENSVVFMHTPDYMEYQPESTSVTFSQKDQIIPLVDIQGYSPLMVGYKIDSLAAEETIVFFMHEKVMVPQNVLDDPLYTLNFASLIGPYSDLPLLSNVVENQITGDPVGSLNIQITSDPVEGKTVFSGTEIEYVYHLTNSGGIPIHGITLVTFLPQGANCLENCGTIKLKKALNPLEKIDISMRVQVKVGKQELKQITHLGYDISTETLPHAEVRKDLIHPLDSDIEIGTNSFMLHTAQVPSVVLNSADGKPRKDKGDVTETQYALQYTGLGKKNTYTLDPGHGILENNNDTYHGYCSDHHYEHGKNSTVYAYNSAGGGCESLDACPLTSSPIDFLITTQSPASQPSLIFEDHYHLKSKSFYYGDVTSVNRFMKSGGVIKPPELFTLSRAIEDGAMGDFQSTVKTQDLHEDLWSYGYAGYSKTYDTCSCGDECTHTDEYPVYTWQKKSSIPLVLEDEDSSPISVYSSTAWLKTQGGHVATNDSITMYETKANRVNLPFHQEQYMFPNAYVHDPETILTPSASYQPFGQRNGDYMIFSNHPTQSFLSQSGSAWQVAGTDFGFFKHGEAYDRTDNPRAYQEDLLVRQKFGPVWTNQLPKTISGTLQLQDGVVYHQTGDLILGEKEVSDKISVSGGQARIYVDGDVYLNANVFYENLQENIPSVRIDARNIYVSGEVQDLELMLLARENFYSGVSHLQLRILGDVIAQFTHWERKPLLENSLDEVNPPSEYLIEDMRKYVLPPPGDTELPDEYDVWRQVNPGTGEVLDAY